MSGRRWRLGFAAPFALLTVALAAGSASATTFCVPSFHAACPSSGGNVAEADVEKAMATSGQDGIADRVVIAPGTFTEEAGGFEPSGGDDRTFEPYGDDPLVVEGAGTGATVLTTDASANIFVFNFSSANQRPTTVRGLTVRVPASFPDGLGGAFQMHGATLEDVDVVSLNPGSDAVASAVGPDNVFRGGEIRGEGGGSIDYGIKPNPNVGGAILVEDATISGAVIALSTDGEKAEIIARRVRVIDASSVGAMLTGGTVKVENSVITVEDGHGLIAAAGSDPTTLIADHVTVVGGGSTWPAIEVKKSGGVEDAEVTISNSILRGFGSAYDAQTPIGPGIGTISLAVRYSNLDGEGTNVNGDVDLATGVTGVDPLLAADLSLPPGSPAIDAGDPGGGGLAADILGAARPADGNGDGVARRDQGAFELQLPAPPLPTAPVDDLVAPKATIKKGPGKKLSRGIARFSFRSSEAGSTFRCKLDRRKAARCRSPKTYRGLKPGRHTFSVWATDAAGNKSGPAKRNFRVPD